MRRRGVLLSVVVGCTTAAALVAVPIVMGGGPARHLDASFIASLENSAYAHVTAHKKDNTKEIPRKDRARLIRCARPGYRAAHPLSCPAPRGAVAVKERNFAKALGLKASSVKVSADLPPAEQIGRWSAPFSIPMLGVHAAMLPTGKVLWFAYPDSTYTLNEGEAWLYDPTTGETKNVDPPINPDTGKPYNVWCGGQTFLPDGRLVVAGGNLEYASGPLAPGWKGLDSLLTFNPWNETWTVQPRMRHGRWYPTLVTLADGRVVIMSGWDEVGNNEPNRDLEVFTPSPNPNGVGTLEIKESASDRAYSLYPHAFLMTNGNVALLGPDRDVSILNTTSWTWSYPSLLPNSRIWGSAVLMPSGTAGSSKVMMLGGVNLPDTTASSASTQIVDLDNLGAAPTSGPTMNAGRAHLNTVLLPDGSLLNVGGGLGQDPNTGSLYSGPVYQSELLAPSGASWLAADTQAEERTYHSTALLLPDGRVLSAGDDRPGQQYTDKGELYTPPYLYKGSRPTLGYVPNAVPYGINFQVATPDAASIQKVVLVAPGATTHANDMNQRVVNVGFTKGAGVLTLTGPTNVNAVPPGYYMLYVLNGQGVPSVAKFIRLDPSAADPGPIPGGNLPPSASFSRDVANAQTGQLVTFTDTSTDADGSIVARAWDTDNDGAFDDGAGLTVGATFATAGDHLVREQVTDNGGASTVATMTVPVSAAAPPEIPAGNLTANPDFETDVAGWGYWQGTVDRVTLAEAPHGSAVAKVTRTAGAEYTIDDAPETVTSTVAGRTYRATAYVKAASPSSVGKQVYIRLRERGPGGGLLTEYSAVATLTEAFQPITVAGATRGSGGTLDVYVGQTGAGAGDAFYADLISLVQVTDPAANQAPVASFSHSPQYPQPGQAVTFTNTSTDPDGVITGQNWDTNGDGAFDDGNGPTATRTFAAEGTYTVQMQVGDEDGATAVATQTIAVSNTPPPPDNQPPAASFSRDVASPQVGETVVFTDTSTDPDGTIAGRAWDTDNDGAFDDGTGATAGATFLTAGTHTVREQVTDDDGAIAIATMDVPVAAPPGGPQVPPGNLTANPDFEASAAGWGGWQATAERVTLADAPHGTAAAKVTRTAGAEYTIDDAPDTITSTVAGNTYRATAYVKAASPSSVGKQVYLRLRERGPNGGLLTEYTSLATLTNAFQPITVTGKTRGSGGTLDVFVGQTAAVAGDAFYADLISLVPVDDPSANQPPNASFTASPANPQPGQAVTFTNTSADPDGVITGESWDTNGDGAFDDGAGPTATKTFAAAGTYTVQLQVADDRGATSVATMTITVAGAPPPGGQVPPGNLTGNPSFETDTTGWSGSTAALARVAQGDAPDGAYAVLASRSSGSSYGILDTPSSVSSAPANTSYRATAYVKAAAPASVGKTVTLTLRQRGLLGVVRKQWKASVTLGTTFTPVTVAGVTTRSDDRVDVLLVQSGAKAGHQFYADLITLVQST